MMRIHGYLLLLAESRAERNCCRTGKDGGSTRVETEQGKRDLRKIDYYRMFKASRRLDGELRKK